MDDLALMVLLLFVLGAAIAASVCAVLVKREFEEWAHTATLREPACTSKRFGKRFYCYGDPCIHCGLPLVPITAEQCAAVERGRSETWW